MAETVGGLLSAIQRIVLENTIDGGLTWGSLWTAAEVHNYLNQRISRFRLETELVQTVTVLGPDANQTIDLPSDLITLKRVAASADGVLYKAVVPADRWTTDGASLVGDGNRPIVYILEPNLPLRLKLLPTPGAAMFYQIIYIAEHTAITTATSRLTIFPIPEPFTPYLLFGVLADMFSKEGEANDPERATYCEQRWSEGIELGKLMLQ